MCAFKDTSLVSCRYVANLQEYLRSGEYESRAVCGHWQDVQKEIGAYFDVMTRALRIAERPLILELLRQLNGIFLESFDVISATGGKEVRDAVKSYTVRSYASCIQVKDNVVSSFKQLVAKLNESAFKSIYRRMYDWAYVSDSGLSH